MFLLLYICVYSCHAAATYNSCDFELGICDWTQLPNDELEWDLFKGITPTDWTGPTRDHTTGLSSGKEICNRNKIFASIIL